MGDKPEPGSKHNVWDRELSPPRSPRGVLGDSERRRITATLAIYLATITIVLVIGLLLWSEFTINRMTANNARLSTTASGEHSIDSVKLGVHETVYLHVTLNGAPIGRRLDLHCEWIEDNGSVVAVVDYDTSRINKSLWPTHCRHRFPFNATTGRWLVSLSLGERELASLPFNVNQGPGE